MRIVLLDPPNFTPPYDHSLASALARRGHEVDLLTAPRVPGEPPAPNGYRRHEIYLTRSARLFSRAPRARARIVLKGLEYVPDARRALRVVDGLRPSVVHIQWLPLPRYDVRWIEALARRYPVVLTAHDVAPRRRGSAGGWRTALGLVDRVIVHSSRAVEQLAALGVPRDRLVEITHPVFEPPSGTELPEPSGRTLLFFGSIRGYKGLDVMLRALPELLRRIPDARLLVAGEAFDPVEPLQRLAAELGVAGSVEWRLGFVNEREAGSIFAEAAAVVLPYRKLESSGVLATTLGYGRPAVVSEIGSLGPIVREHGAGLSVPPEDPAALAEACARLLEPGELAAAARGAERARKALTWDRAAGEHERVYAELVEAGA